MLHSFFVYAVESQQTTKVITATNGDNVYTKTVTDDADPILIHSTTRTVTVSNSAATYTKVFTEGPNVESSTTKTLALTNSVGSSTDLYTKTVAEAVKSSGISASSSSSSTSAGAAALLMGLAAHLL